MATTQKGIYYPDDYTAVADVPEDMKKQAESVDIALGELEDNIEQNIQPQIDDIQEEQITQNNEITALQTENTRLKATLPTTTGTGENITLSKTAELEFIQHPIPRGNSKQVTAILPTGYTQLDYIESTGTQYIDTGFKPTQNTTKVIFDGVYLSTNRNYFAGIVQSNTYYGMRPHESSVVQWNNGAGAVGTVNISLDYLNKRLVYKYDGYKLYVNDELKADLLSGSGTTFNINLYLFARNSNNTADAYASFRLYSCKIYDNTTLVRNFVPCKNASNEVGLYDLVSQTFFGNSGSGTFTAGNTATIPNPSYPQPISNVTGDVEVLVQNKNLFVSDLNKYDITTKLYGFVKVLDEKKLATISAKDKDTSIDISGVYFGFSSDGVNNIRWLVSNGNYAAGTQTTQSINNQSGSNYEQYFSFYPRNEATFNKIIQRFDIQIEYGTKTSYTPHKEKTLPLTLGNIELCEIGTAQDYFYKDSGKWYLYKAIGKVVLDGSEEESWTLNQEKTNSLLFSLSITEMKNIGNVMGLDIICNCYTPGNAYALDKELIEQISRSIYLNIAKSRLNTIDTSGFKTWLSSNNVIVYYLLNTPTSTEITDTTLIEQLDAISQVLSYEEQTHISGTSDESNPLFSVEAYQSIKLVLQEISNAVVALGGV